MPAMPWNIAALQYGICPGPSVANVILPGWERPSAMSSFTLPAASVERATRTKGEVSTSETGVKSRSRS